MATATLTRPRPRAATKPAEVKPAIDRRVIPYRPFYWQRVFHRAVAAGYKVVIALCGIRAGKSIAGANEVIRYLLTRPKTRAVFVAPTYDDAESILEYTILEYLPHDEIAYHSARKRAYYLPNGSVLYYRTAENPQRLRALGDLHIAWIDEGEQQPRVVFNILRGRVGKYNGPIIITTSPQKWFGDGETSRRLSWIFQYLTGEKDITPGCDGPGAYFSRDGETAMINWGQGDNPYYGLTKTAALRETYGPLLAAQELDGYYVDLFGGDRFKKEWLVGVPTLPEMFDRVIIIHDPALSEQDSRTSRTSFVVSLVWGLVAGRGVGDLDRVYCFDEIRGRGPQFSHPAQVDTLKALCAKYNAHEVFVEDVAQQRSIIQDLRRDGVPAFGVKPDGNKETRAARASGAFAAGQVFFADRLLTADFKNEVVNFPNWPYKDRVDCISYAINILLKRPHLRFELGERTQRETMAGIV